MIIPNVRSICLKIILVNIECVLHIFALLVKPVCFVRFLIEICKKVKLSIVDLIFIILLSTSFILFNSQKNILLFPIPEDRIFKHVDIILPFSSISQAYRHT